MPEKDEVAQFLAQAHYRVESELEHIFRIRGRADVEAQPGEPIKLLEVHRTTIPSGVMPLQFAADPAGGVPFSSVIVEVTPQEYEAIASGEQPLPHDWHLAEELHRDGNGEIGAG